MCLLYLSSPPRGVLGSIVRSIPACHAGTIPRSLLTGGKGNLSFYSLLTIDILFFSGMFILCVEIQFFRDLT